MLDQSLALTGLLPAAIAAVVDRWRLPLVIAAERDAIFPMIFGAARDLLNANAIARDRATRGCDRTGRGPKS